MDTHNYDATLTTLYNYHKRENYMIHIFFGPRCCRNVNLFALADVYRGGNEKIICDTSELDWNHIIFNNTFIYDGNRMYVISLLEEFINYGNTTPINILLNPSLKLGFTIDDVKEYILSIVTTNNNESKTHNRQIELQHNSMLINQNDYLLVLKKYHDKKIVFGFNCNESQCIYNQICYIAKNNDFSDNTYVSIILLYLWYTQHSIHNHGCVKGCCTLKKYLESKSDDAITTKINNILNGYSYPKYLPIQYIGPSLEHQEQCNKKQKLFVSLRLGELFSVFANQLEHWLLMQSIQSVSKTADINELTGMLFLHWM